MDDFQKIYHLVIALLLFNNVLNFSKPDVNNVLTTYFMFMNYSQDCMFIQSFQFIIGSSFISNIAQYHVYIIVTSI
jgi:hypothetical protein